MASLRDIKKRIRSVKNIAQITKAMEVVSMNKMRKSQQFAFAARPYSLAAVDMLKNLLHRTPKNSWPEIFKNRKATSVLLVVITADKGLVGGFNDNVIRKAENLVAEYGNNNKKFSLVTVGKKAHDAFERENIKDIKNFTDFGDLTTFKDTKPLSDFVLKGFIDGEWDAVDIVYTHFKTTLKQEATKRSILPLRKESLNEIVQEIVPEYGRYSELKQSTVIPTKYHYTYVIEPSAQEVMHDLVTDLLRIAVHHVMLESNASEHSARMVTMKSASDNAGELKDTLTLESNKLRQSGITSEISEIIAGAEALK